MAQLLAPSINNIDWNADDSHFLFLDDDDFYSKEWNTLLTLYYAIQLRLNRMLAESKFNERETTLFV